MGNCMTMCKHEAAFKQPTLYLSFSESESDIMYKRQSKQLSQMSQPIVGSVQ